MSDINETGAGAVGGFQIPLGIKQRKAKIDELLKKYSDIDEGIALSYFSSLSESAVETVGQQLDSCDFDPIADEMRTHAVRELVRNRVREVVRKKAGGGGYVLYSPNKGKKKNPKPVATFPTKIGAKRAELARYPPKDPGKLQRLRKEVDRLAKDPKKRAEKEKNAAKQKGTDDSVSKKAHPKKESVDITEATPFGGTGTIPPASTTSVLSNDEKNKILPNFMAGLKKIPQNSPERGKYITQHMSDPKFLGALKDHPQGQQVHKQLMGFLNGKQNATSAGAGSKVTTEAVERRMEFMHRQMISRIIKESLFNEERTGSEWDELISKISSKALNGDKKFQNFQKNIQKKTSSMLEAAFNSIRKAVGKKVKLKNYGIKHNEQKGMTYLVFGAELDEASIEPIYIYIQAGVPKIEVSSDAKVGLTKADPDQAKLFRAELVTVQEAVLDRMDELSSAIEARDKYLTKVETGIDSFVAGLSSLELSLLKQLLVKKYKKIG